MHHYTRGLSLFLKIYLTLFYVHWCEDIRSPGTEVTDSCELPCGCWELNLGPLQGQLVILTTAQSLQPLHFGFSRSREEETFSPLG